MKVPASPPAGFRMTGVRQSLRSVETSFATTESDLQLRSLLAAASDQNSRYQSYYGQSGGVEQQTLIVLQPQYPSQLTQHLNQVELSRRWRISPRTLERWRWLGTGPPYAKIGGRVVYLLGDIEAYEAKQKRG
jgi:hypothetical protein